jgi:hypothetical protein
VDVYIFREKKNNMRKTYFEMWGLRIPRRALELHV